MCAGARFAESNLALLLASVLWVFEIRPPLVMVHGRMKAANIDLSDGALEAYPVEIGKTIQDAIRAKGGKADRGDTDEFGCF